MGQKLVIAEKPSVAGDIAKALGGFKKNGDFWVGTYGGDEIVIGSAVGHLLEIAPPEEYDVKRGKWSFDKLPVVPPYFELVPIKKTESKFNELAKKIRSRSVTSLVNACDAGREGELIFKYIVQAAKSKKPIERLWLQSMTKDSIRTAFARLRPDSEMKNLESSARCRSEADWLVGINGTRALTAFNSKEGGFFLTTVGRVQTPTLSLVVRREEEIRAFTPRKYWEVEALFKAADGEYKGKWFDPKFEKKKNDPSELRSDRIWSQSEADAIVEACRGKSAAATESTKRTTTMSPALFDLTSLQREANSRFGFSAKTTLALAQRLYERHKVLTYPRTDARALPEDYIPTVHAILNQYIGTDYGKFAGTVLANNWVRNDKRIFNNAKISDHFAIIPTGELPKSLDEAEQKLYDLVVRRFISVFYPAAEFDVTTRITESAGHSFITEGKVLVNPGWMEVAGRGLKQGEELCRIKNGESVTIESIDKKELWTKPPARYSDATLLSAMETAGKKIEDGELRDAMAEKGLGTPATRAQTIEGLIDQKYIRRDGRELIPNAKAFQLMQLLRGLSIDVLTQPMLTAKWEQNLSQIEQGGESREDFMGQIQNLVVEIVDSAKHYEGDSVPIVNPLRFSNPCPACGGEVVENYRRFACTNPQCYFSLPKHPAGRAFEPEEVEELLKTHRIGPLSGFISKRGFPFESEIVLEKDKESGEWGLKFAFEEKEELAPEVVSSATAVAACPCCGGRILDLPEAYMCENNVSGTKNCSVRLSKTILKHEVTLLQAVKLFTEGSTDFYDDFVSNRTKRPFTAQLVFDPKKGVSFNFSKPSSEGDAEEKPSGKTRKTTSTRTTRRKKAE